MPIRSPESKILPLDAAVQWRESLRRDGRQLAVTNGCFDLLHRGHAEYLARARGFADALLVAVNSDASVRAIKGPDRPVVREADRAYLLASLEAVDAVVVFAEPKALDVLRAIRPDLYVKGGDYTEETLEREEYALLKGMGCQFRFVPFVAGLSTTEVIRQVRAAPARP